MPLFSSAYLTHLREMPLVTRALWIVQSLLALLFVFAGSMKLVAPIDDLVAQTSLPGLFIRFVGLAELLGGLGLILPGLLRIRPSLTPLAALELVHVMLGACVLSLAAGGDPILAVVPLGVGLLAGFVAYGRWRLAPHGSRSSHRTRRPSLQVAS
jgi:hypothetical protein